MSTTPADSYGLPPASRLADVLQALMTEYPTDDAEFSPDAVAAVLTVMPLHGDDQGIAVEVPLQAGQVEWLTALVSRESAHTRNKHSDESGQCGHCAGTGSARTTDLDRPAVAPKWPIVDWFGTRDTFTVTGPTAALAEWASKTGWEIHSSAEAPTASVWLVHTGTTPEPIYLLARVNETLLWDGWHLKVAGPDGQPHRGPVDEPEADRYDENDLGRQ